jgi:hypothetical protein
MFNLSNDITLGGTRGPTLALAPRGLTAAPAS